MLNITFSLSIETDKFIFIFIIIRVPYVFRYFSLNVDVSTKITHKLWKSLERTIFNSYNNETNSFRKKNFLGIWPAMSNSSCKTGHLGSRAAFMNCANYKFRCIRKHEQFVGIYRLHQYRFLHKGRLLNQTVPPISRSLHFFYPTKFTLIKIITMLTHVIWLNINGTKKTLQRSK